jgi:hypothetical protein
MSRRIGGLSGVGRWNRGYRHSLTILTLSFAGLYCAACGSLSWRTGKVPAIPVQPPVATTLSWFAAVNAHKQSLALAHFVPAHRQMMEWSSWPPPFRHLQCTLMSGSATNSQVRCTFDEITDPSSGMSNTNFWDVSLQRHPPGPWLINNYGQG